MKKYFTFFFICCYAVSSAQFAIVSDKDGFVHVRDSGSLKSKVTDSLATGHLIYCLAKKGNWTNIDFTHHGKELNGFIYKDRFTLITQYARINTFTSTDQFISLKRDSVEIKLTVGPFESKKHRYQYYKQAPTQIALIDNKKYWGKDGGLPTTQINSITIQLGAKKIVLPKLATEGLYEPNLTTTEAYYDPLQNSIFISMMNSDGAGSYEIIWRITNGIYRDRLVAYGF